MATPVLIPVEEYLRTVYRPDCDYIDGEVQERNMGERPHARLQSFFIRFLAPFEEALSVEALPAQRLQISPTRYRIPDVMLAFLSDPDPRIIRVPPLLCIEILSSKDTMRKVQERLDDYSNLGVKSMWVIYPWRRLAFAAGTDAVLHPETNSLAVEGTGISITAAVVFSELEKIEKLTGR